MGKGGGGHRALRVPERVVDSRQRARVECPKLYVCRGSQVAGQQYFWDLVLPELMQLFGEPWGEPIIGANPRQRTATPLAMRALRRTLVVDSLFKRGYYWESHALIRSAYEDWLQIAFLMHEPGDARCEEYAVEIHKHDARVYDAFKELCGQAIADHLFPAMPADVAAFVGLPRGCTNPPSFASLADDVGLRKVHDFVYTYLSGRSHPTGRTQELFDASPSIAVAQIPTRDPSEEIRLALWHIWFTARVLVLASREFGIDREPFCEQYLLPLVASGQNLETCVFVREYGSPT